MASQHDFYNNLKVSNCVVFIASRFATLKHAFHEYSGFSDRFLGWSQMRGKGRLQNTTKKMRLIVTGMWSNKHFSLWHQAGVNKHILLHIFGSDECNRGENLLQSFLFTNNATMQQLCSSSPLSEIACCQSYFCLFVNSINFITSTVQSFSSDSLIKKPVMCIECFPVVRLPLSRTISKREY